MSIIRIKKEREYVSISNTVLQDKRLSWEARGVMAYLLSKPDGWQCRNYDLVKQSPAGKHVIQRVLKELQEYGYMYRYQKSDGQKIEWITEIYEDPTLNTHFRNPNFPPAEIPTDGKPAGRKSGHIVSTDSIKDRQLEKTDCSANRKNLNDLADAIANICQIDIDTCTSRLRDELKEVTIKLSQKDNVPAVLEKHPKWWYANDWRGKKGQPPTPGQIADSWGAFESSFNGSHTSSSGPILTPAQLARLREFEEQNRRDMESANIK